MELTLNSNFIDLSLEDLDIVNGGATWKKVAYGVGGTIMVAHALPAAVLGGPGAGALVLGGGLALLGDCIDEN